MCGSATLAMVVSSACMMVASITDTVMSPRWATAAPSRESLTGAPSWLLPRRRLRQTKEPVAGPGEQADQLRPLRGRQPGKRLGRERVAQAQRRFQRIGRARREVHFVDAPIGRAGKAPDPAGRLHAIAQAGDGHRRQVELLRELDLRQRAPVAVHRQHREKAALCAREADARPGEGIELVAIQLGDLVDEKSEPGREVDFHTFLYYIGTYETASVLGGVSPG